MKSRLIVIAFVLSGVLAIGISGAWALRQRQILQVRTKCRELLRAEYPRLAQESPPVPNAGLTARCPGVQEPYVVELMPAPFPNEQIAAEAAKRKGARPLAWCPQSCHDGYRNVLLDDGSVQTVPPGVFEEIVKYHVMTAEQRRLLEKTR